MSRNLYCLLGIFASIGIAATAQADKFPDSWKPWVTLGGAVGVGIGAFLHESPLKKEL